MKVRNPHARFGEKEIIEVDLFQCIERFVEAKIECARDTATEGNELERLKAQDLLELALAELTRQAADTTQE